MFFYKITMCFSLIVFLMSGHVSSQEKIIVFNFNKNELSKLKSHSIKKKTDYTILIDENGSGLLKAEAEGQASGLGKEIKVNLKKHHI